MCGRQGTFRLNQALTVYRNYQKITLQESPGTVPAGRVPRYKEVILTADLIDRARPGEDIEVTGVYKYRADGGAGGFNARNGFPVFSTCIEVREGGQGSGHHPAVLASSPIQLTLDLDRLLPPQANYVHKREDMFSMLHITDDDKANIHRIAAAPNTRDFVVVIFFVCVYIYVFVCLVCFGSVCID